MLFQRRYTITIGSILHTTVLAHLCFVNRRQLYNDGRFRDNIGRHAAAAGDARRTGSCGTSRLDSGMIGAIWDHSGVRSALDAVTIVLSDMGKQRKSALQPSCPP